MQTWAGHRQFRMSPPGLFGAGSAYVQAEAVAHVWVFSLPSRTRRRSAQVAVAALLILLLRWAVQGEATGLASGVPAVLAQVPVRTQLVALTFALPTPSPAVAQLALALEHAQWPATIFAGPRFAAADPAALRALVQAGDEVDALAGSGPPAPAAWAARLQAATGVRPLFVQATSQRPAAPLLRAAAAAGLEVVTWSAAPPSVARLAAVLRPGAILKVPPDAETLAALPGVADDLNAAGYTPVTLAEMVAVSEGGQGLLLRPNP